MQSRSAINFLRVLLFVTSVTGGVSLTAVHIGLWGGMAHASEDGGGSGGDGGGDDGGSDDGGGGGSDDSGGDDGANSGEGGDDGGAGNPGDTADREGLNRYLEALRHHGKVKTVQGSASSISVTYTDGWRESISGKRYRLFDNQGRRVVDRPARKSDYARLRAVQR